MLLSNNNNYCIYTHPERPASGVFKNWLFDCGGGCRTAPGGACLGRDGAGSLPGGGAFVWPIILGAPGLAAGAAPGSLIPGRGPVGVFCLIT